MVTDIIIIYLFLFFTGCCFGSFFNLCIYRIPRGESIAFPRSHCTNCGKTLGVLDLVPVFSYLLLRGRCRYCKTVIPVKYLMLEMLWGLIFVLSFYKYQVNYYTLSSIIVLSYLSFLGLMKTLNGSISFGIKYQIIDLSSILAPFLFYKITNSLVVLLFSLILFYFFRRFSKNKSNISIVIFITLLSLLLF